MKKLSPQSLIIIYVIGIGVSIIISVYFLFNNNDPFPEYKEFYNTIISVIGALLGLLVVISLFYLGKFHDYKIRLMQYQIEIKNKISIVESNSKRFSELGDKCRNSMNELKQDIIDHKFGDSTESTKEDLTKNLKDLKKEFKELEKDESIVFFKMPKQAIQSFVMNGPSFIIAFSFASANLNSPIIGYYYFLIVIIGIIGVNVIVNWFILEDYSSWFLRTFHNYFRFNAAFDLINEKLESELIYFRNLENQIFQYKLHTLEK